MMSCFRKFMAWELIEEMHRQPNTMYGFVRGLMLRNLALALAYKDKNAGKSDKKEGNKEDANSSNA